jgi:hypothetical protein
MKKDNGLIEAQRHGIARSPEWPKVEKEHLMFFPLCAVCGISKAVQVHHIFPFHYCIALGRPDLELDQRNLITLCETEEGRPTDDHHLLIGHLDDFKSSNLNVVNDSKIYNETSLQIKDNKAWVLAKMGKLKALDLMTLQEKIDLLSLMNKTFPKV